MKRIAPPLLGLVAALAQRALTGARPSPSAARGGVSACAALASVSLAGAARRGFWRSGTTVDPFRPERSSVLVTTGVNAITRNPMYVGLTGLLVAHATWRGSWVALAPVAGFVLVIDRTQIAAEESALRATFGSAYDAYRAATPRWLDRRSLPVPVERARRAPGGPSLVGRA